MRIEKNVLDSLVDKNQVFGLARKANLFVIGGRVYYASGNTAGPDTFVSNGRTYGVRKGPSIVELEAQTEKRSVPDYEAYQEKLISQEVKKRDAPDGRFDQSYVKLVNFAFNNIFPYLRKENSEALDSLLKVTKKKAKISPELRDEQLEGEIERYVLSKVEEIASADQINLNVTRNGKLEAILLSQNLTKSSVTNSRFFELTNGHNFGIVNGSVYFLATVRTGQSLTIDNRKYSLLPVSNLDNFAYAYVRESLVKALTKGVREKIAVNEELRKVIEERSDVKDAIKAESYHEEDFGFERRNSSFEVFVDVPDHVLQDFDTTGLYYFKGHRIAVTIGYQDGNLPSVIVNPHAMENVSGPFYSGRGLCMGYYGTSYLATMERGKAIAKYLVDARNVILHGYVPQVSPHHRINNFYDKKITAQEVKRKNLPITNINRQRGEHSYD